MAAPKGTRPPGGSRKGVPNKITADLKGMLLGALKAKGGQKYLERQADENPTAFLGLVGKILPMTLAGDAESPLTVVVRRFGE
jgi:hypothetical protein